MRCAEDLGYLKMLRIYHDNTGELDKASWKPEKFILTDLQANKQ
jgi:hypothetical protein